ncbi:MAG: hypothetical protein EXS38_05525 [Opitutus sp.]|nr:hypothetical protein [Opitutus sp.]
MRTCSSLFTRHLSLKAKRGPGLRSHTEGGFALLITITLLAFLVILLVGLATYTRIETAIAGNTQRQGQARENALMAMNVALGQLQKYAGPDQRATATAEANNGAANPHWTGIWDSDPATTAPRTWFVSGNEKDPLAVPPTTAVATTNRVELVGLKSAGTANSVVAPLQTITAPGVPGQTTGTSATIGRYAWWVGDQGVKAPVAVPDNLAGVTYAPYDSDEKRSRIRQQIGFGAGAADASGAPVFEPHDSNNTPLVQDGKIAATNQLAFLKSPTNTSIGLTRVQQNFHTWSPNNYAVLANTKLGGLREDLSLAPQRLGSVFSAWARYDRPQAVAMEIPVQPEAVVGTDPPGPMPAYGSDPVRRRFSITPNVAGGGLDGGIHPVLAFFGMSFSIRDAVTSNYEVSVRCVIGLWNPYSSSLVPPAGDNNRLELHISGLPEVLLQDSRGVIATRSLQTIMGGQPLRFTLAWPAEPTREDEASWLPGRVYYWTAESNTAEPSGGNVMVFNERNSTAVGGAGIVRPAGIAHVIPPPGVTTLYRQCSVANGDDTTLRVQLVRSRDQVTLATFDSPRFSGFQTSAGQLETAHKFVDFAYVFRLPDSAEIPEGESATWLSAAQRDPRRSFLPGSAYVAGENGPQPELYGGPGVTGLSTRYLSRLIDRPTDSHDYNEDVPVFELPRGPFLSMGALQHLIIPNARPFAIGNPWGTGIEVNGVPANALFDRFFFSGLMTDVVPATNAAGDLVLPNPLLKPLRKPDATKVTIDDIRNMANPPSTTADDGTVIPGGPGSAISSKFFLQGGAFNLNSTSAAAWAAVLRNTRFTAPQSFNYHDVAVNTGTAADETQATVQSDEAQFFRFSHSAQETYKAEWPPANAEADITPPRTDLYRQGMRTLTSAQVAALAAKIVELLQTHASASGPFRTLEGFLSPSALFALPAANEGDPVVPRSLLEAAIADAGINAAIAEFSSQWLSQADVMTALAPVLFPRSDTFVIRSYGEAVNPTTSATEGKAWCEAIVQRVPEYFGPGDPPETPPGDFDLAVDPADPASTPSAAHTTNKQLGRRFKVVSFRWLTRSDI